MKKKILYHFLLFCIVINYIFNIKTLWGNFLDLESILGYGLMSRKFSDPFIKKTVNHREINQFGIKVGSRYFPFDFNIFTIKFLPGIGLNYGYSNYFGNKADGSIHDFKISTGLLGVINSYKFGGYIGIAYSRGENIFFYQGLKPSQNLTGYSFVEEIWIGYQLYDNITSLVQFELSQRFLWAKKINGEISLPTILNNYHSISLGLGINYLINL
jgi:hypothetical protein